MGVRICRELDMVREGIKKLIESMKVEKKYKKKKRQDGRPSEIASNAEPESTIQSEIKTEIDELDRFIKELIDTETKAKEAKAAEQSALHQQQMR